MPLREDVGMSNSIFRQSKISSTRFTRASVILITLLACPPMYTSEMPQPERAVVDGTTLPILSRSLQVDRDTPVRFWPIELRWIWQKKHEGPTEWMRVLLVLQHSPAHEVDWYLRVVDRDGKEVDRVRASSFQEGPVPGEVWTKLIGGDRVTIELHSKDDPEGLVVRVS